MFMLVWIFIKIGWSLLFFVFSLMFFFPTEEKHEWDVGVLCVVVGVMPWFNQIMGTSSWFLPWSIGFLIIGLWLVIRSFVKPTQPPSVITPDTIEYGNFTLFGFVRGPIERISDLVGFIFGIMSLCIAAGFFLLHLLMGFIKTGIG